MEDPLKMAIEPLLANFLEISEILLENSSIKKSWVPYQFFLTGPELDRFAGKLIQLENSEASHRPFYWKTHPN